MHADEVETDVALVRRLLAGQFPREEALSAPRWDGDESGCMATSCRATCSSSTAACRRSSTSVASTWAIRRVTCSLPWNVFAGNSRVRHRAELQVDDASWLRGRGWALYQAVSALPYYWDTNPGMVRQASHALAQILADRL
jgi:hypothetical protein